MCADDLAWPSDTHARKWTHRPPRRGRTCCNREVMNTRKWLPGIGFLGAWALIACLYLGSTIGGEESSDQATSEHGVTVEMVIRGFDAARGEFSTLVTVHEPDGNTRNEDLDIFFAPTTGAQKLTFKAGDPVGIMPLTVLASDGDITTWPLDSYQAEVDVVSMIGEATVPTQLSVYNELNGWSTQLRTWPRPGTAEQVASIQTRRAPEVMAIAAVLILVLAMLPIFALVLVRRAVRDGRKPEAGLFGWMSGMLFATVPIRNFFPGSPPPGSAVDVFVVVWVVLALVLALGMLVHYWITTTNR
jgi:hypothetical protein